MVAQANKTFEKFPGTFFPTKNLFEEFPVAFFPVLGHNGLGNHCQWSCLPNFVF